MSPFPNKGVFHAMSVDDMVFDVPNGDTTSKFQLRKVLHEPHLGHTVTVVTVSVGRVRVQT
jgi:hypothetical protein